MTKKTNLFKKVIAMITFIVTSLFIYLAYILFAPNFQGKTDEKTFVRIPDNSTFESVIDSVQANAKISNVMSFKQVAKLLQYNNKIRPGRYEIKNQTNNFRLIRMLRSGRQTPVRLTFNNIRTKEQLAVRLSNQLMADSASIVSLLSDSAFLSAYNLNSYNSISIFIPDTYEVFWDLDAVELFERMMKEYNLFWNSGRKAKAAAIPLSQTEVSVLASIVEEKQTKLTNDLLWQDFI
jgi:UPF0755 protein